MASTPQNSLRVAVAGVTGYAGAELARILLDHPRFATNPPIFLGRPESEGGAAISLTSLHPNLSGLPNADDARVIPFDWNELQREGVELMFLATPHEQSREWSQQALAHNIRVVDLSAAWRLDTPAYRAIYKLEDTAATDALQQEAVYGSPELHAAEIKTARLVANPGCYATSVILGLSPVVRANIVDLSAGIIADAKSGVSGAGKAPTPGTHFMYAADNLSAYAIFGHRHTGELYEQLSLQPDQIQFTPHLLPIPRGILSTIYVRFTEPQTIMSLQALFDDFYRDAPLVRVRKSPMTPQIQHVVRTSFCDIGFQLSPDGKRAVIIACLDNLLKGAASQAVENMNLMAGWPQQEGLI
ncbi:N-acetyl-gamma-glutamyl-phosphate reductase [Granulicella cerasi]|uniref:N-acetyl-gamma-glutamyl-phosphate reductase n=1 Tax=Granulicella cerasi TaxID=741063 RepID=A0ABW1Z8N3_9BACT|nr:N-acetyl-gamma-glutamyl-phosphate reductase [Granulicella cerasi]